MWGALATIATPVIGSLLSGKGSKDSAPSVERSNNMTPEQLKLLETILGQVQRGVDSGVEAYPGSVVPETPQSLEDLIGMAGGYTKSPLYTAGTDVLENVLTASPDYGATRDFWTDAIFNPAMSMFKKDVLPSIREGGVSQGNYLSSGRQRAETNAAGDLMTNLTGQLATLMYNEKESTLDRALKGVPLSAGHMGSAMDVLRSAGLLERGMEGERLQEDYSKWSMEQPQNNPWLQMAPQFLGMQTSTPYVNQPGTPWYGQLGQTMNNIMGTGLGYGMGQQLGKGGSITDVLKNLFIN